MAESKTRLMKLETVIEAWLNEEKNSERINITKEWHMKAAERKVRKFTKAGGGVLTVPGRKRESGSFATVDIKKCEGEVALSRAMFNSRTLTVSSPSKDISKRGSKHEVISFEAPLLRLEDGNDGTSRTVACDLVTVASSPFRLTAVEVKAKKGKATNIDYGLVESWIYGQLLALRVANYFDDLKAEALFCRQIYLNELRKQFAESERTCKVEFALAGPLDYFHNQLKKLEDGNGIDSIDLLLTDLKSMR